MPGPWDKHVDPSANQDKSISAAMQKVINVKPIDLAAFSVDPNNIEGIYKMITPDSKLIDAPFTSADHPTLSPIQNAFKHPVSTIATFAQRPGWRPAPQQQNVQANDLGPNPKNTDGLYKMNGPQGQIMVPYPKVEAAKRYGLTLDRTDVARYGEDVGHTWWQTGKDNFNAQTQGADPDAGRLKAAIQDFGAGGGDIVRSVAHPIRTVQHILSTPDLGLLGLADAFAQTFEPNSANAEQIRRLMEDEAKNAPNVARALGQLGTGAILGEVGGRAIGAAAPVIKAAPTAIKDWTLGTGEAGGVAKPSLGNRVRIGNAPTSLTPAEQSAVQITKAVNPSQPAWNEYIQATHDQIGNVLDFAQRNKFPISSARDLAKVAEAAQKETIDHYLDNFIKPNADKTAVITDTGYQGKVTGNGRATLSNLNSRIDEIDTALSSGGVPDARLLAEKRNLETTLHRSLAEATGVAPDDIANLRIRSSQLGTIARESRDAANSLAIRSTNAKPDAISLPSDRVGVARTTIDFVRGGPENIASGKLRSALGHSAVEPTPLIEPKVTPAAPTVTTPEGAQAEFLKAQELEQAAQQAAAKRGEQARLARSKGQDRWVAKGKQNVMQHLGTVTTPAISVELDRLSSLPGGKQLLMNAGDLTPGSPGMYSLVQRIKTVLGH